MKTKGLKAFQLKLLKDFLMVFYNLEKIKVLPLCSELKR